MVGSKTARVLSKIPAVLRRDLELRRQALGREGEHYLEFVAGLLETLQPEDLIEHMLAVQAADHAWHISRLRQIETALLAPTRTPPQLGSSGYAAFEERFIGIGAALHRELLIGEHGYRDGAEYHALKEKLEPAMRHEEERLKKQAQHEAQNALQQVVAQASTPESLAAAYVANSAHLEKISRGIVLAESRFTSILNHLERYRAARHPQDRGEASPVVDAEFIEVDGEEPRDIAAQARSQPAQRPSQHRTSHRQRQGEGGAEQPKTRAQRSHPSERRTRKGGA
jgi:hypothetical protein